MIYKIHLLDDDRKRKGEEREKKGSVVHAYQRVPLPPKIGHASSLPRVCFWKMRFVFARQIGCPPRNVFRGWISSDGIERVSSRFEQFTESSLLFSYWKRNFVTICKLCDWREKRKALDYIFEYFCCSFFFSDVKNVYFKKVWSIYFFLMLIRILIINP